MTESSLSARSPASCIIRGLKCPYHHWAARDASLAAVNHRLYLAAQVGEPRLTFDEYFPS
ncbi:MAG TPA: hypothetical protein VK619_18545 [Pyrinomonadaceae bacterium]|nr:hypothetical protein [Pyrinomonadaceae bacterium]